MLKQRVITAFVLLGMIMLAIFLFSPFYFGLFVAGVIMIGAWEWSRLAGFKTLLTRLGYLLLFAVLLVMSWRLPPQMLGTVLAVSLVWWVLACYFILLYPRHTSLWGHRLFLGLAGLFVLLPGWLALLYLRELNNFAVLILMLFATVSAVDIGAYFSGRAFGRSKMAPRVSPNKTWEGFWGGVLACCLLVVLAALLFRLDSESLSPVFWVRLIGFSLLLGTISVVGDLLESMVKRFRDVKDSGSILPGHGGILDRIDSITAAAPVYVLLLMSMGVDLP